MTDNNTYSLFISWLCDTLKSVVIIYSEQSEILILSARIQWIYVRYVFQTR